MFNRRSQNTTESCSSKYPSMLAGMKRFMVSSKETQPAPTSRKRRIQCSPESGQPRKLLRRSPSMTSHSFSNAPYEYEVLDNPEAETSGMPCSSDSHVNRLDENLNPSPVKRNYSSESNEAGDFVGALEIDCGTLVTVPDEVLPDFRQMVGRTTTRTYRIFKNKEIEVNGFRFAHISTKNPRRKIVYQCKKCLAVNRKAKYAKQPRIGIGCITLDTKTDIIHGNPQSPGDKNHICNTTDNLFVQKKIPFSSVYRKNDNGKLITVPKNVDPIYFAKHGDKKIVKTYRIFNNLDIELNGWTFFAGSSTDNCTNYVCRACKNISKKAYLAKKPIIKVGTIHLDHRTQLIHGDPREPGSIAHICNNSLDVATSSGTPAVCEIDKGKSVTIPKNVDPIFNSRLDGTVVRTYKLFVNGDIETLGCVFTVKRKQMNWTTYICTACCRTRREKDSSNYGAKIGTITLDHRTKLIHGDPRQPRSIKHICGKTFPGNEAIGGADEEIEQNFEGVQEYDNGNHTGDDESDASEEETEAFDNLPELDMESFELELQKPDTVYGELRAFRNSLKEAFVGENTTNYHVYILFTRSSGSIQEMIKSIFSVGTTTTTLSLQIANLKNTKSGIHSNIIDEQEIWITTLPLGPLSENAATDCRTLFQYFIDVRNLGDGAESVFVQTIAEIKNPVLSKLIEEMEEEGCLTATLIQVLHAAMRISSRFCSSKEAV